MAPVIPFASGRHRLRLTLDNPLPPPGEGRAVRPFDHYLAELVRDDERVCAFLDVYLRRIDARPLSYVRAAAALGSEFLVRVQLLADREEAESRVREILRRLKLELHPEKTRRVELSRGRQGFDFLGCHLHKRMSGPIWEKEHRKVYFLQRWPSTRSMTRVRQRVKELSSSSMSTSRSSSRVYTGRSSPVAASRARATPSNPRARAPRRAAGAAAISRPW